MIPVRARKVLGDLLTRWGRTLLTIAGLAFGLFGSGSVLVAFLILKNDLNANFLQTNPPNITVDVAAVSRDTLERVAAIPGVSAVESRPLLSARMDTGGDQWGDLSIQIVEDFARMRVAKVFPESGAWPPPTGGMLIERDGKFFLFAPVGQPVNLRLSDGRKVAPVLSGFAFDPGQAPSRMEHARIGFVSRATAEAWGYASPPARLLITVKGADAASRPTGALDFLRGPTRADEEAAAKVRAAAAAVRAALAAEGAPASRMVTQSKLQHPHQFQLNATLALLGGVGIVCLALSAILIANLVDALMTGEQRVIGVMKALGARSRQIAFDYLLGVSLLGLISGAMVLPLCLRMGRGVAASVAGFLNFKLMSDTPQAVLYAAVLGVAVLTPILVAALRVWSTTRSPVREALARPSLSRSNRIADAMGALAAPLPMLPRIAARNLARSPRRALLTAVSLALGLTFFLTALNLRASLFGTIDEVRAAKPYDLQVSFRDRHPAREMLDWIAVFPNVAKAEAWSSAVATLETETGEGGNPVGVVAVPPASAMIRPQVIAGRWLDPARPDGVVVTQRVLSDDPLVRLGGTYRMAAAGGATPVRVIGVIREFGPAAVYAVPATVNRLTGQDGLTNHLVITLKDSSFEKETELSGLIEESVNQSDWRLAGIQTSKILEVVVRNHLEVIAQILLIVAALMLSVGAIGLASSISVSVVERTREVGVMKALGGRSRAIAVLFVCEALFVGLLGWALSLAAAPWLSRALSDAFGALVVQYPFSYRADPLGPWLALGVAVLIAPLSAALPIRAALITSPLRALRSV